MKGFLNDKKIDYVLFHLGLIIDLTKIKNSIIFIKDKKEISNYSNKIIFQLSEKELNLNNIFFHKDIPILFPCNKNSELVNIENSNLVFNHDIIKSAFYLLSGFQETKNSNLDFYGRFPFKESIQNKQNFISKPIVNYYFKFISDSIISFIGENLKKENLFKNYGLILTHDIDNIKYYTFPNFLYKIKELIGLSKTKLSNTDIIKYLINYISFSNKNPYWNFDKLIDIEKKHNYKSSFYFLKKEQKNIDSSYIFSDKIIKKAFKLINSENFEIGLHGTASSALNKKKLHFQKQELEKNAGVKVYGGRQHRLIFKTPDTLLHQEFSKLQYDSSLCFAEHEGFRNSYCLPFKLYDFEKDKIINVWEFPLIVMDTTLFHYRKYNKEKALIIIKELISEIKQFYGIFTMLWHNGFELDYANGMLNNFYEDLLKEIETTQPESILAKELVKKLNSK